MWGGMEASCPDLLMPHLIPCSCTGAGPRVPVCPDPLTSKAGRGGPSPHLGAADGQVSRSWYSHEKLPIVAVSRPPPGPWVPGTRRMCGDCWNVPSELRLGQGGVACTPTAGSPPPPSPHARSAEAGAAVPSPQGPGATYPLGASSQLKGLLLTVVFTVFQLLQDLVQHHRPLFLRGLCGSPDGKRGGKNSRGGGKGREKWQEGEGPGGAKWRAGRRERRRSTGGQRVRGGGTGDQKPKRGCGEHRRGERNMDSQSPASLQGCLSPAPGTLRLGSARHPLPGFLPPTEARAPVRKGARRASPSSPEADGSRAGLQRAEHPQRGRVKREQLLGKKAEASPAFLEATDSSWCRGA